MSGSTLIQHPDNTEYRDVAGVRMPWHFGDFEAEYRAIRGTAALFDHSMAGLTRISGGMTPLLQRVLARDVEFLTPERSMMTLMLADDGHVIDLLTVYSFDDYVLLESSPGRQDAVRRQLCAHASGDVEITVLDGEWGMLGVEGPYSWGALGRVLDPAITALPYESVLEVDAFGTPIIFSRSGYTGEYGYKIIGPSGIIAELWDSLRPETTPAGQQALETAMLEVRQPVLHREGAVVSDVVACGMAWLTDPVKQDFAGRDHLIRQLADRESPRMLGLSWADGELAASAANGTGTSGAPVTAGDHVIGTLAASSYSPGLGRWLGLAAVDRDLAAPGLTLGLTADGRAAEATTLAAPYVIPASWTTPIL